MVEKIKKLCKEQGLTISEIQSELGMNKNAIARWDEHRPSVDRAKAVADRLGVTVDELIREEDSDVNVL